MQQKYLRCFLCRRFVTAEFKVFISPADCGGVWTHPSHFYTDLRAARVVGRVPWRCCCLGAAACLPAAASAPRAPHSRAAGTSDPADRTRSPAEHTITHAHTHDTIRREMLF